MTFRKDSDVVVRWEIMHFKTKLFSDGLLQTRLHREKRGSFIQWWAVNYLQPGSTARIERKIKPLLLRPLLLTSPTTHIPITKSTMTRPPPPSSGLFLTVGLIVEGEPLLFQNFLQDFVQRQVHCLAEEVDRGGCVRQVWRQAVRGCEEHRPWILHRGGSMLPHGQQELQVRRLIHIFVKECMAVKMKNGMFALMCQIYSRKGCFNWPLILLVSTWNS